MQRFEINVSMSRFRRDGDECQRAGLQHASPVVACCRILLRY